MPIKKAAVSIIETAAFSYKTNEIFMFFIWLWMTDFF